MIAHLFLDKGRFAWSGHLASGDPAHKPWALIVEIGRDFTLTEDGQLYLTGPGPQRFQEFSPGGVALAARSGMFGFKVVNADELASRTKDRETQRRKKLGRRGRIAEDQCREATA